MGPDPGGLSSIQTQTLIKGNHVNTQQEGGHLQAKEKGLERNSPASTLTSGHPTSKTVVQATQLGYFVIAA